MLFEDQHPHNRSVMAAVLGEPNVGKSSLINQFLGVDLSVVTNKPQTTRNRYHCVVSVDRTEVIFVDTPGVHKSSLEINLRYNEQARESIGGVDVNLIVVDMTRPLFEQLKQLKSTLDVELSESWLVLNKMDRVKDKDGGIPSEEALSKILELSKELIPSIEKVFITSAKTEEGTNELLGALLDRSENRKHRYSSGEMSNKNMRFFATEYIREQAFLNLKDEIPYEVAVVLDSYEDRLTKTKEVESSKISATILVNRPSQRAIVVGSKGSMIKKIGMEAREKIEKLSGSKVHLNLHVKVSPKWFKNNFVLEEIGLPRAKDSHRVWRAK
ncbi:MAG: GTPase Era [Bacteriovoracaceae bacterium]